MPVNQILISIIISTFVSIFTFLTPSLSWGTIGLPFSQIEDHQFASKILPGSEYGPWIVKYRVILPKGFNPDEPQKVVYFLHGRNGDRYTLEQLGILDTLNSFVDERFKNNLGPLRFIIVQPECQNCYWMNAAYKNARWADVITQELIYQVEQNYHVFTNKESRLIAGISMGGHGAIQLSLNFPNIYGATAAHSPVFRTQEEAARDFYYEFGTGNEYQERDPFSLINYKGKSFQAPLFIDMGAQDPFIENTRNFAHLIQDRRLSDADLRVGQDPIGGHDMGYWRYHLKDYLHWYTWQLHRH